MPNNLIVSTYEKALRDALERGVEIGRKQASEEYIYLNDKVTQRLQKPKNEKRCCPIHKNLPLLPAPSPHYGFWLFCPLCRDSHVRHALAARRLKNPRNKFHKVTLIPLESPITAFLPAVRLV